MKRLIIFFTCFFLIQCVFAQKRSFIKRSFKRADYDTSYVDSYYDHFLHVTAISVLQDHDVFISDQENNKTIRYKPNGAFKFGVGLDFRYFSIEFSKSIDAINKPDPAKGETNSFSLRLGVTGRRFLGSMLLQSYTGMYISNPTNVLPNWNINKGYPLRNDMTSEILLLSLNYIYNHKQYSTMASLWQIDRQKKSAGSFTTGITYSVTHLKGDSSFVTASTNGLSSAQQQIIEGYNYSFGINAGYAHNFIIKSRIFFNMTFIPGIDLQNGNYKTTGKEIHTYFPRFGYHGDLRLIAGYNGRRYYSGVHYANYFINNHLTSDVNVNLFNGYLRFFIGRRFDLTPKHKKK